MPIPSATRNGFQPTACRSSSVKESVVMPDILAFRRGPEHCPFGWNLFARPASTSRRAGRTPRGVRPCAWGVSGDNPGGTTARRRPTQPLLMETPADCRRFTAGCRGVPMVRLATERFGRGPPVHGEPRPGRGRRRPVLDPGGKPMKRRLGLTSILTIAILGIASPAFACGGLIGPRGSVNLLRTTTLAGYHDGIEHYVTAF